MLRIREATVEDIPAIQKLSGEVWPHTFEQLLSPGQIDYMMDMMYSTSSLRSQITEQNHHFVLAEEEGKPLGYMSYEHNCKGKKLTKIHKIYILPSAQAKGVGRFLIGYVSQLASTQGVRELSLNVNKYNEKAIGFYQRMGFEIVSGEENDIGSDFIMDDYVMNKKL